MFAYCGNNPVCFTDYSGFVANDAFYKITKDSGYSVPTPELDEVDRFIKETEVLLDEILNISSAEDLLDLREDFSVWYTAFENFQALSNTVAVAKIVLGVRKIKNGFVALAVPVPTIIDEMLGLGLIVWGTTSIIGGLEDLKD